MRHITIPLLLIGVPSIVWSQAFNTPLSLISSAGGQGQVTVQSQSFKVEWTIGETFIGGGSVNNQSIVIGEQQGIRNDIGVSISDLDSGNLKVYPNPAEHYIQIDNLPDGVTEILLYSINGSHKLNYTTSNAQLTISTSRLLSGMYALVIFQEHMPSRVFKIAITNN